MNPDLQAARTASRARRVYLLLIAAAWLPSTVCADDRLDFEVRGNVTPSCGLADTRVHIDLGRVPVSDFEGGQGSAWRGATFIGVDCLGVTRARVTLRATPDTSDPRYVAHRGSAKGVAIALRTADGQPLLPDDRTPVTFDWAGGPPELAFEARYVQVGPLSPGDAPATALIQITWE